MKKEKPIICVDQNGVFQSSVINNLSYDDLYGWIKRVLWGQEPGAGADRDELPHGFLEQVYRQLNPNVREAFQDAVLDHLSDMVRPPHANWLEGRGDELLSLIEAIFEDSFRNDAPVDLLYAMVKTKNFHPPEDVAPNLHRRILETLIAVRFKADANFWLEQYAIGGDMYASVVISGLVGINLSKAFNWVKIHHRSDTVIEALFDKLPYLISEYGEGRITSYLNELGDLFSDYQRSIFFQHAKWLNMEFIPQKDIGHDFIEELEQDELSALVENLKLDISIHSQPLAKQRTTIAETLCVLAEQSNFIDYTADIRGITEIIGILQQVSFVSAALSSNLRKRLELYLIKKKKAYSPPITPFTYNSLISMVKDTGGNPMNETRRICCH